jgi:Na+-transporting methylmalonyl-CoA/oxaloacetate decarboxylase gamma subunit
MSGEGRAIFGLFLLTMGPFLLWTSVGFIFGVIFILIGAYWLITGVVATGALKGIHGWRDAAGLVVPPAAAPAGAPTSASETATGEVPPYLEIPPSNKVCPACNEENARAAAFCRKCGAPLPPPS